MNLINNIMRCKIKDRRKGEKSEGQEMRIKTHSDMLANYFLPEMQQMQIAARLELSLHNLHSLSLICFPTVGSENR